MQNTSQFLHLACNIHVAYESLRARLADHGLFDRLAMTYKSQRHFFPDRNSAEFWDDIFESGYVHHPMAESRENIIVNLIDSKKNILNIGVGRGFLEQRLFKLCGNNVDYCGTDITPVTINKLRKSFPRHKFILCDPWRLPFDDSSRSQVMLLEVLEHIKPKDTFKLLSEINRITMRNGIFILSVPINEGLIEMLPSNPNSHMRLYTEQIVKYELRTSGFSIEKIIRLSAFNKFFRIKSFVNNIFHLRVPNNLILVCRKVK